MNVREILAANLRRLRAERAISQEALADLAGIDRTYISAIERRIYAVSIDKLAALARCLDVQPYKLLVPLDEPDGPETLAHGSGDTMGRQ